MRKISVVAPVGTSPPVVTEFVDYVERVIGRRVSDLTLLSTKEEEIQQSSVLIKTCLAARKPWIHIHEVDLPFTDISTQESSLKFMEIAARILSDQKTKYEADEVYLCVAGGRKDMCIIISILGGLLPVNGVYHVIMPSVVMYNQPLELLRKEMADLYMSKEREAFYEKKREKLDPVMFPDPSSYNVIKIPVVPVPTNFLQDFCKLRQDIAIPVTRFHPKTLQQLEKLGYVALKAKGISLTQEGAAIRDILQVFR
jgi:CRISPR-associated protein Csx14